MREKTSTANAMGVLTKKESYSHMTNLVALLILLGSETRLRILQALANGPKNVTTINAEIGASMPTTSQQLQPLLRGDLIELQKRATERWYSLRLPMHPLVEATLQALRIGDVLAEPHGEREIRISGADADGETVYDSGSIKEEGGPIDAEWDSGDEEGY